MSLKGSATETANLSALCGKISRVSPYSIDASLTQEGAAAEAKAAGVAIGAIKDHVEAHTGLRENPHNVTKRQIGLGDVDNTADIEKPVSNPQKEALAKKVDKETNKGLSTNDFTDEYREKLDGIEAGANKYEQPFDFPLNTEKYADASVTTDKYADASVTAEKLASSAKSKGVTALLLNDGWTDNEQTVDVEGVTADNNILVAAAPDSRTAWNDAEIYCSAQADGTLTFKCGTVPTANVTANVVILV